MDNDDIIINDSNSGEFESKNLKAPFTYFGEMKNGVPDGTGFAVWHGNWEGHTYEGEFKDCNMHGHGVYTWANGDKYDGEWKEGYRGRGIKTYTNGNKYDGEWKDGNWHGHGVWTWADGSKYDGNWKDGNQHGHGVKTWASGSKYDGEWKDDLKHGHGVLTSYFEKYDGDYKDGKKHGQGVWTGANGDKYDGEWKDGKKHGHGVYTRRNWNEKYVGEWKNDMKNGNGVSTWSHNGKYDGEWENNKYHGHGVYTGIYGNKYEGEYKDGKKHGQGIFTYKNGTKYEGEFKDGKHHGKGVKTWPDGETYDGEWKYDKKNGHGIYTFGKGQCEGDKYDGEWKNDKYHGHGIYTYADGSKYDGKWKDGKLFDPLTNQPIDISLENKILNIQDIIQQTILYINNQSKIYNNKNLPNYEHSYSERHQYKKLEKSELHNIINQLNELFKKSMNINPIYGNLIKFMIKYNTIHDELSKIIKKYGTNNIENVLNFCFGSEYIKNIEQDGGDDANKYNIIKKFIKCTGYKIINWNENDEHSTKGEREIQRDSEKLNKCRIINEYDMVRYSETMDCFDMARTSRDFYTRVYGIIIVFHNKKQRKTLIVYGNTENLMLTCLNEPFITNELNKLKNENPERNGQLDEEDYNTEDFNRFVDFLMIKDLLIYSSSELHRRYECYLSQIKLIKQQIINKTVSDFIGDTLYLQRKLLIQLFMKKNDPECKVLLSMLYNLLINHDETKKDSDDQIAIYDSLPWKIKKSIIELDY